MKPVLSLPLRQLFLLFVISLTMSCALNAQGPVSDYQQFITVYNEKKYEDCVRFGEPLAGSTDHPGIQYKLAECYCEAGQVSKSLGLLGSLAARGLSYKVEENKGFSRLYGDKRFVGYAETFKKNRAEVSRSEVSFVINDSLLIPEGISFDNLHQNFFVGSLARHKVISCEVNGSCSDFANGRDLGFWAVLGMKPSPDFKSLWICSASENDSLNGYSGVFQIEIPSGKLIRKFVMDNKKGPHLFNDLVITGNDIYFTDSKAGKVWRSVAGSDTLSEYAAGLVYPNGIAVDEENKILFVADFMGVYLIDLTTGKKSLLRHQGKTYLNGIDGLYYYKGSLIGIQDSGNQDDRIVRFYYDIKAGAITKVKTLQSFRKDFIIPTTGVIVDGQFHYIANAQLRSLQPDGSLTNPEKLVRPVILKVKLD